MSVRASLSPPFPPTVFEFVLQPKQKRRNKNSERYGQPPKKTVSWFLFFWIFIFLFFFGSCVFLARPISSEIPQKKSALTLSDPLGSFFFLGGVRSTHLDIIKRREKVQNLKKKKNDTRTIILYYR